MRSDINYFHHNDKKKPLISPTLIWIAITVFLVVYLFIRFVAPMLDKTAY